MKSDNKDVDIPDIEIISGIDYWLVTDFTRDVEMLSCCPLFGATLPMCNCCVIDQSDMDGIKLH